MGVHRGRIKNLFLWILFFIIPTHGLNLGLIAGDNRRLSSPLVIKKVAKLSPVFININSGLPKVGKSLTNLPKLPPKPPPLKLPNPKSPKPKRSLPPLIPFVPKLPLLPIIPILPPLLPPIPLIPRLPIIPPLPIVPPVLSLHKLKDPLKPLRIPILKKSSLSALEPKINIKRDVLKNLLDLKKRGSLTTLEFFRFKKLLKL